METTKETTKIKRRLTGLREFRLNTHLGLRDNKIVGPFLIQFLFLFLRKAYKSYNHNRSINDENNERTKTPVRPVKREEPNIGVLYSAAKWLGLV